MFSLKKRSARAVVLAGVLCMALAGCSSPTRQAKADLNGASLAELIAQAKKEGGLNLVWTESFFGGSATMPLLTEGFRKQYGLPGFNVRFTPGPAQTQQAASLAQEALAGQPAGTDIFLSYAPSFANLVKLDHDVFPKTDWSWAKNVPAAAVAPDGVGVAVQTSFPVITYNSKAVKSPPKSMQDLLDPRWNGRIASTPYASNFHYFAGDKGSDKVLDYLRAFSDRIGGLIQCNQPDRLVSGEFDILAFDCDQTNAVASRRSGGPLRYVIPSDAAMLTYIYAGVPVNSAHPAAARLWINYVMSREAQDIIWEHRGGDSTYVEGSHMSEVLAEAKRDGVTFSDWTLDAVLNSGRFPDQAYVEQQVAILSGTV